MYATKDGLMKIRWFSPLAVIPLLLQPNAGHAHQDCKAIVTSAQSAADKADWVVEGNVVETIMTTAPPGRFYIDIENAKVLYELEKLPKFVTASFRADACFPNKEIALWGKAANKLVGKRMRFFGMKATSGRGQRVFYMQPADQAAPSFQSSRKEFTTAEYPHVAMKVGADGWFRAHSTDGAFSIDMPGPFADITKGDNGEPAFMLRGTDQYGSTFLAVFERSGPNAEMGGTFDSTIEAPNANVRQFKGAEAVYTLGNLPGSNGEKITHGLWFRVPGGTFMLGIVTDKAHEAASLKSKERFFNSLSFE
jgi:hypothetical protein